jgi:hypothetical protein
MYVTPQWRFFGDIFEKRQYIHLAFSAKAASEVILRILISNLIEIAGNEPLIGVADRCKSKGVLSVQQSNTLFLRQIKPGLAPAAQAMMNPAGGFVRENIPFEEPHGSSKDGFNRRASRLGHRNIEGRQIG